MNPLDVGTPIDKRFPLCLASFGWKKTMHSYICSFSGSGNGSDQVLIVQIIKYSSSHSVLDYSSSQVMCGQQCLHTVAGDRMYEVEVPTFDDNGKLLDWVTTVTS